MVKYFFLLLASLFIVACSQDDKPVQQQTDKKTGDDQEIIEEINLTPEEKFSTGILIDFLDDSEDDDLASFLETEIFKMGASYNGCAVVEVTPSTWLVIMEKDSTSKNYLLQKYVDFKTNENYFNMKETTLGLTDVIARRRSKTSAGE